MGPMEWMMERGSAAVRCAIAVSRDGNSWTRVSRLPVAQTDATASWMLLNCGQPLKRRSTLEGLFIYRRIGPGSTLSDAGQNIRQRASNIFRNEYRSQHVRFFSSPRTVPNPINDVPSKVLLNRKHSHHYKAQMAHISRKLHRILCIGDESCRVAPWATRVVIRSLLLSLVVGAGIFYYTVLVMETNVRSSVSRIQGSEEAASFSTEPWTVEPETPGGGLLSEDLSWTISHVWSKLNYTQLIAPKNFSAHYRYVYVVHSRVQSRELRDAVRQTWGHDACRSKGGAVVFLLGYNRYFQRAAESEAEGFNDILQYDIAENYANLTRKSIMMLKWAGETLSKDTILVKADDDVFVNVFNLERALEAAAGMHRRFIAGRMMKDTKPVRDPLEKWFVPEHDYPQEYYPTYLAGCLYAISGNMIVPMLHAIATKKIMGMEDVYITGILSENLPLRMVGLRGINSYEDKTPCEMHDELARHYISARHLIPDYYTMKVTIRICRFWLFTGSCWCESIIDGVVPGL